LGEADLQVFHLLFGILTLSNHLPRNNKKHEKEKEKEEKKHKDKSKKK
jgi:hypothetical protein